MAIDPTGNIFFQDEYEQQYLVDWETVGGVLDITTEVRQPYVWNEEPSGFIKNGILFRQGIITIHRQVLELLSDGYIIVAEGVSQFRDFIQMNFPCEQGPTDPFEFHLDCAVLDKMHFKVLEGPHWADPTDSDDDNAIWGDLNPDGSPLDTVTLIGGAEILEWVDIWN